MEFADAPQQPPQNQEQKVNPEIKIDPHMLAVATITKFPGWYPGEIIEGKELTSKIRGDDGLQALKEAKERGYQVLVVDGGSSDEFINELTNMGIVMQAQSEEGYSAGRQQSYREASKLGGVKVIFSTEAEKVSAIQDSLSDEAIELILEEKFDIVLLKRPESAFETYPKEQAEYEQKANKLFNDIMKTHGLLPQDADDLDVWFGPRLFKNDPDILDLLSQNYEFEKKDSKLDQITDPSKWSNALFLPIVNALKKGVRVGSLTVPYKHPTDQTSIENNDPEFKRKRVVQYKDILRSVMHLVRMLENNPKSRLRKI